MYDEIVEKILKSLDENLITAMYPKFSGDGYREFKIDKKNFHEINKVHSNKKTAFVDGGNAEIIGSANFSLNLIKAAYAIYKNNKKIEFRKFELLAFTQTINQGNEIYFKTTFFATTNAIQLEEICFSSFDHTLMLGINRAEISHVANAIRRFAELKVAKFIADKKIADIIVLDSNLQSTITNESQYLDELYKSCIKNNIILTALSKTTSLFTDDGNLLSVVLDNISKLPTWYYHPIVEINNINHKAEMFFVKFHNKSKHIFRFEIFNLQKANAEETINMLTANCNDPIFIGYPYGLVEADKIARISNQERETLKTILLVKLKHRNIEKYLSAVNAHEILDKISF